MYFLFNNSTTLFLAIFYVIDTNSGQNISNFYIFVRILELILFIISAFMTLASFYMSITSKVYHFNVSAIYVVFSMHWFEMLVSRFLVGPYQEGFVSLKTDTLSPQLIRATFDDSLFFTDSSINTTPLLIGSFLRIRYILIACFALPTISTERAIALVLVRDYERKRRAYISLLLIFLIEAICTSISVIVTFRLLEFFVVDLFLLTITIASYIVLTLIPEKFFNRFFQTFFITRKVTKKLMKKCRLNASFYTLSIKYQLSEIGRTNKLIHLIIMAAAGIICMNAGVIALGSLGVIDNSTLGYMFVFIEYMMHVNPIFIVSSMFYVTPSWTRKLFHMTPNYIQNSSTFGKLFQNVDPLTQRKNTDETSVYFEQLRRVW